RYRKAAGLSVYECARQAGIPKTNLLYWESGERTPKAPNLQRLASALGIDFEELFELAGFSSVSLTDLPVYLRKQEKLTKDETERVARYVERIKQQKRRSHGKRDR
ncbi:MAG: helix-turn-helix domain-containing protein, partial [Mycobacteriales bacterium]